MGQSFKRCKKPTNNNSNTNGNESSSKYKVEGARRGQAPAEKPGPASRTPPPQQQQPPPAYGSSGEQQTAQRNQQNQQHQFNTSNQHNNTSGGAPPPQQQYNNNSSNNNGSRRGNQAPAAAAQPPAAPAAQRNQQNGAGGLQKIPSVQKEDPSYNPTPNLSHPPSSSSGNSSPTTSATSPVPNFTRVKLLGRGAQGQVWKAQFPNAPADQFVVVKEMLFSDRKKWDRVRNQALAVKALQHNHLIQYIDVFTSERPLSIAVVMPFYKEKDMLNYLNSVNIARKIIPEFTLCSLILQVAKSLHYLHTRNPPMIHRDVKPENILMFDNYERTLLMDLDMSRELPTANAAVTRVGTPEYMCPEGLRGQPQTPKSDIWSLGACFLVLGILPSSLKLPNPRTETSELYNSDSWAPQDLDNIITQTLDKRTNSRKERPYSQKMKRLVQEMMRHDPNQRPDAQYVVTALEAICTDCLLAAASA